MSIDDLASATARALESLKSRVGPTDTLLRVALDCHPWNGSIEVSALTHREVEVDPALLAPAEMAAWRYHAFTAEDEAWQRATADLRRRMAAEYLSASDRREVTRRWLRVCADALVSDAVRAALASLPLSAHFACSVTDPDTDEAYVSPG